MTPLTAIFILHVTRHLGGFASLIINYLV